VRAAWWFRSARHYDRRDCAASNTWAGLILCGIAVTLFTCWWSFSFRLDLTGVRETSR
jgi:hypothetical protein